MKAHALNTIQEFEKIRLEYKNVYFIHNLNDQNYYSQLPNQIDKVILFLTLNLQNLHDNLCDKKKFDKILPTGNFSDYNEVLQTYFKQNKSAFIYNLSSIIETFFRKLHQEKFQSEKIENKKFYNIANEIFGVLSIDKSVEWKALMILFNLRNTIHNNGLHTSEDRVFEYHSYTINFEKGFSHNVAHYEILAKILTDFKNLFVEILNKTNNY